MNAPANLPTPSCAATVRNDGWTADRRRQFLEGLAAGHSVDATCSSLGLSRASAYALRNRDPAFALGWNAASLRGRAALADLLTSRAVDGVVETWTRADGTAVTRHRHDNQHARAMLARLDRLALEPRTGWREDAEFAPARAVAHDFDAYLDLIENGDCDALAAGRFVDARVCQLRQLRDYGHGFPREPKKAPVDDEEEVVWFDGITRKWCTILPPPEDFDGEEAGRYGDGEYARTLTAAERAIVEAREERMLAERRAAGERRRASWFGGGADAAALGLPGSRS